MREEDTIDLKRLAAILRRQKFLIAGFPTCALLLASSYILLTAPLYTASTDILLDESVTAAVSDISSVKEMSFEKSSIESEVEVMKSREVTDSALFILNREGHLNAFAKGENDKALLAERLVQGLGVSRVGETYILSIRYTSTDPNTASAVANAYAQAYIAEELEAMQEISSRTVVWMQTQTEELSRQVIEAKKDFSEYRKLYNEFQRAETEPDLGIQLDEASRKIAMEGGLGKLRALEQQEKTLIALYDSYLEKLETYNMQQSFPVTETRIITYATPPKSKSHPRTLLLVGAALIFGTGIGLIIAIIRDTFDRSLRRAGQLRRETGAPFLGFFPERKLEIETPTEFLSKSGTNSYIVPLYRKSIEDPFSLQSETIRVVRNAIDLSLSNSKQKVIGIISAEASEGCKVVASNLAGYIAQSASCVLIDADIRQSTPIINNSHGDIKGVGKVLCGSISMQEVLLKQSAGRLALLPSVAREAAQSLLYLNKGTTEKLINECKNHFEYIIVNLPPLCSAADAQSFTQVVNRFVIVAEWGKTLPNSLNFQLTQNGIVSSSILGVVLENTDMKRMQNHYGHTASLAAS